jgi:CRP-like cAMP-binding protein
MTLGFAESMETSMNDEITHQTLLDFDVFGGLERLELDRVLEAVDRCQFEAGENLIGEGETSRELYCVVEGRVEVLKTGNSGQKRRLAVLEPGVVMGEHGFILAEPRTATVRALDAVDTLCLSGEAFDRLDAADDDIGRMIEHNILRMLAHRQQMINQELLDILDEAGDDSDYHFDDTGDVGDVLMERWTV